MQALRAALRWAAGRGKLIAAVPPLTMPERPPARDRWLTREEAARLVAACGSHHVRLFVLLALHTAARAGAILALTWDRVDMERRRIDFREPDRPETRKRRVAVPINVWGGAAAAAASCRPPRAARRGRRVAFRGGIGAGWSVRRRSNPRPVPGGPLVPQAPPPDRVGEQRAANRARRGPARRPAVVNPSGGEILAPPPNSRTVPTGWLRRRTGSPGEVLPVNGLVRPARGPAPPSSA